MSTAGEPSRWLFSTKKGKVMMWIKPCPLFRHQNKEGRNFTGKNVAPWRALIEYNSQLLSAAVCRGHGT
jgi:hypothetical protein